MVQQLAFQKGDLVRHALYGVGRIIAVGYRCAYVHFRNGITLSCTDDNLVLEPF